MTVQAPGVSGLQIGDGATQINVYGPMTVNPPLAERGPVFSVPPLSGGEVARPELMAELTAQVLRAGSGPVTLASALLGAGGFGKTTLARLLVHDPVVRAHFPDGIVWVTLGEAVTGADLADKVGDVCAVLTGVKPPLADPGLAGAELGRVLGERRLLLVLDDAWSTAQVQAFSWDGPHVVRLVTTRLRRIVADFGPSVSVDAMADGDAHQLLLTGLGQVPEALVAALLDATGRWPVLLALVNGAARQDVQDGQSAATSLAEIGEALRRQGPTVLDVARPEHRTGAVRTTLAVSLARLSDDERERYLELAVFGEDVLIPRVVLERFWEHTAGWSPFRSHRFCQHLRDLSLLAQYRLDSARPRILVHDVVRDFLRHEVRARMPELHRTLVQAHRDLVPVESGHTAWWRLPTAETYLWSWLTTHLADGGLTEERERCVRHPEYVSRKLEIHGSSALMVDLGLGGGVQERALAHMLTTNEVLAPLEPDGALRSTFAAHLRGRAHLEALSVQVEATLRAPFLRPVHVLPDGRQAAATGHSDPVRALVVHPHVDNWLAGSGDDGMISVWNPSSGRLFSITGSASGIGAIDVSPDGRWLAGGSNDGRIQVWDTRTAEPGQALTGHRARIRALRYAPDGSYLASAGGDGTVRIWDTATSTLRHVLRGHAGSVQAVVIDPGSQWVASAGDDGDVRIWDPVTGAGRAPLVGHTRDILSLQVSPDGRWLASAGTDGQVIVRDSSSGHQAFSVAGHTGWVWALAFSPDNRWLASSDDGSLRLTDLSTGGMQRTLRHHRHRIAALAFSPDSATLACSDADGDVYTLLVADGSPGLTLTGDGSRANAIVFGRSGHWVAAAGDDGTVRIWDPATGTPRVQAQGAARRVHALALSPDGTWVASAGDGDEVCIWDTSSGTLEREFSGAGGRLLALAVSHDGSWQVAGGDDGDLWMASLGELPYRLRGTGSPSWISSVVIGPDDAWLASGDSHGDVLIRHLPDAGEVQAQYRHEGGVVALCVPATGAWLASAGRDGTVVLIDVPTGQVLTRITRHDRSATALVTASDGTWVASGSWNAQIRVWHSPTGEQSLLAGHHAPVQALAVSPDNDLLASGGDDALVIIWNPFTGRAVHQITAHASPVRALTFSPDGQVLVTSSWDGTIRVWDVATGQAVTAIRINGWIGSLVVTRDKVIAAGRHGPYIFDLVR